MSMQQIREQYRVPAKRGVAVIVDGRRGVITGSERTTLRLLARFDGDKHSVVVHPTWRTEYLTPDAIWMDGSQQPTINDAMGDAREAFDRAYYRSQTNAEVIRNCTATIEALQRAVAAASLQAGTVTSGAKG